MSKVRVVLSVAVADSDPGELDQLKSDIISAFARFQTDTVPAGPALDAVKDVILWT